MISERDGITTEERFKRLQLRIIFVFSGIIFMVTAFLSAVILGRSNASIRKSVSSLIAANSRQLELNINSYLENVEQTVALLFADEDYYLYDETAAGLEEYDKIKMEEQILDRIVDLGLMENFADFCIVYADDYKVGWCSRVTSALFPEGGMYDTFSAYTLADNTNDGWCWGIRGNVDRMYYVKRLNPNAVLVVSFYNKELDKVFQYPEQLHDLTIRLVNEQNQILFSSDEEEIGKNLPDRIQTLLGDETVVSIMNEDYLVNSNTCENGWRVICSIPTDVILKDNNDMQKFTILFAICLGGIFIIAGMLMLRRVTRPMDGMVSNLAEKAYFDQLSGVFNKIYFQDQVSNRMEHREANTVIAFSMIDVDNFKQINDRLGHAYGDTVIIRMGQMLKKLYKEGAYVGRLGGDEFAIYKEISFFTGEDVRSRIEQEMQTLLETFDREFYKEHEQCDISLSVGIYIDEDMTVSFQDMYTRADTALYHSKRNGKNQYTIYSEGLLKDQKEMETNEEK